MHPILLNASNTVIGGRKNVSRTVDILRAVSMGRSLGSRNTTHLCIGYGDSGCIEGLILVRRRPGRLQLREADRHGRGCLPRERVSRVQECEQRVEHDFRIVV